MLSLSTCLSLFPPHSLFQLFLILFSFSHLFLPSLLLSSLSPKWPTLNEADRIPKAFEIEWESVEWNWEERTDDRKDTNGFQSKSDRFLLFLFHQFISPFFSPLLSTLPSLFSLSITSPLNDRRHPFLLPLFSCFTFSSSVCNPFMSLFSFVVSFFVYWE